MLEDIVANNKRQIKGAIWNTLGSGMYGINSFDAGRGQPDWIC